MLVNTVFEGTPAARAGIVPGDIVESVNAAPMHDRRDYINVLRNQTDGEDLRLQLRRVGRSFTVAVRPTPFEDDTARALMEQRWGFVAHAGGGGLAVASVRSGGPANFLRKGDVIAAVGATRVNSMKDLLNAFRRERLASQVLLQVLRGGRAYYTRLVL
ncbi:hypothetical protein AGMMS50248_10740 [Deltaproteobacteria bacterium]|nr:hypothetical protein AGMMS50248_10740 [Deltaproteobacteria bacterium]